METPDGFAKATGKVEGTRVCHECKETYRSADAGENATKCPHCGSYNTQQATAAGR